MSTTLSQSVQNQVLPYELWLHCLKFAIMDSADGPLPYLAVSTHWRDTIIQSPALWTSIIINSDQDELARVHTFLALSAGQLLDVVMSLTRPEQDVEPALRLVMVDSSRIRSIGVLIDEMEFNFSRIFTILFQSPVLTELEEFDLGWGWLPEADQIAYWLSRCPKLRIMGNYPIRYESLIPAKATQLVISNLSLKENYAFMRLHRVDYLYLKYRHRGLHEDALLEVPIQGDTHTTEYLGVWRMRELAKGVGQQLQQLVLTFEFTLATQFVPFISLLTNLRDLWLGVEFGTDRTLEGISFDGLTAEDMKHLRIFTLGLFKTINLSLVSPGVNEETVERFLRIFTDKGALESLDVFNLHARAYSLSYPGLISTIRSAANVRSLTIDTLQPSQRHPLTQIPALELPRLVYLSVQSGELLDSIPMKAPNLVTICIEGISRSPSVCCQTMANYVECSAPETIRTIAHSSSAQYVETMTIHCASASKDIATFPHIRTLEFLFGRDKNYQGNGIDELLLELLRQPDALPCLRILRTNLPPFWELLFEFFRHRNASKVSRLSTLTLPILPAFPILYRLVAFLQGQSNIYTTRDFDDVIHRRSLFHRWPHSCYCLEGGHLYCIDGSSAFSLEEISRLELLDLVHMDLAASTEDFRVSDWGHWEMLLQKEKLPKMNCYGGDAELVDITQYTLQE